MPYITTITNTLCCSCSCCVHSRGKAPCEAYSCDQVRPPVYCYYY